MLGGSLDGYATYLGHLGIKPPLRWVAGMEDLKGRGMWPRNRPGYNSIWGLQGNCIEDTVVAEGIYQSGDSGQQSLRPFFERLYDRCGLRRPDWLNNPADGTS